MEKLIAKINNIDINTSPFHLEHYEILTDGTNLTTTWFNNTYDPYTNVTNAKFKKLNLKIRIQSESKNKNIMLLNMLNNEINQGKVIIKLSEIKNNDNIPLKLESYVESTNVEYSSIREILYLNVSFNIIGYTDTIIETLRRNETFNSKTLYKVNFKLNINNTTNDIRHFVIYRDEEEFMEINFINSSPNIEIDFKTGKFKGFEDFTINKIIPIDKKARYIVRSADKDDEIIITYNARVL